MVLYFKGSMSCVEPRGGGRRGTPRQDLSGPDSGAAPRNPKTFVGSKVKEETFGPRYYGRTVESRCGSGVSPRNFS